MRVYNKFSYSLNNDNEKGVFTNLPLINVRLKKFMMLLYLEITKISWNYKMHSRPTYREKRGTLRVYNFLPLIFHWQRRLISNKEIRYLV
uniref:Uncharacterized protein n=1 Tax=Lepeophtheirus salmonis TaxID=72036 RepID=A0A0K2V8S6_LEPSM